METKIYQDGGVWKVLPCAEDPNNAAWFKPESFLRQLGRLAYITYTFLPMYKQQQTNKHYDNDQILPKDCAEVASMRNLGKAC